jgi:hypothetical protein
LFLFRWSAQAPGSHADIKSQNFPYYHRKPRHPNQRIRCPLFVSPASVARHPRWRPSGPENSITSGSSSITVIAGESEFEVNESLIRSNSGYFEQGLSRREYLDCDNLDYVKLPKLSGKAFQTYLGWINSRVISLVLPLLYSRIDVDQISDAVDILISCYEASNKLRDNDFKDLTLDTVIQLTTATRMYSLIFTKTNLRHHGLRISTSATLFRHGASTPTFEVRGRTNTLWHASQKRLFGISYMLARVANTKKSINITLPQIHLRISPSPVL